MNSVSVYEKMFYALDYLWDKNKDATLGEYLNNANPFFFAEKISADPAIMTEFLQFLYSQYGHKDFDDEEAFQAVKKYLAEEPIIKEDFPSIANHFEKINIQMWKEICRTNTSPTKQKYCLNPEEIDLLTSLIGKEFEGYYSDSLLDSTDFTYLYFCVGGKRLLLENALKPIYYLDDFHDYTVLSVNVAEDKYFDKRTNNSRAKFCALNKKIRSFDLVTDTLSVSKSSEPEYQTVLTRGVIFHLEDGAEVSFEKDDDEEFIYIHEGVNTYEQFNKTDIEYDSPYVFNCTRTVESFFGFKEFDVVKTKVDKKVPTGSEGTIVCIYKSANACEIEFTDNVGHTIDLDSYSFEEIELVAAFENKEI